MLAQVSMFQSVTRHALAGAAGGVVLLGLGCAAPSPGIDATTPLPTQMQAATTPTAKTGRASS